VPRVGVVLSLRLSPFGSNKSTRRLSIDVFIAAVIDQGTSDFCKEQAMADFLEALSEKTGVETDQAHQGVGALLTMLKSRLDPETFAKLKESIPNSEGMLAAVEQKLQGSGLFDAVKGMASKFLGGNGQDAIAALKGRMTEMGMSSDHLQGMLPKLHDMLKDKLPPDVIEQIQQHLPAFNRAAE
jgi:hypothetical protein